MGNWIAMRALLTGVLLTVLSGCVPEESRQPTQVEKASDVQITLGKKPEPVAEPATAEPAESESTASKAPETDASEKGEAAPAEKSEEPAKK